jgi:vacuolar-type H+-ATPase subunit H
LFEKEQIESGIEEWEDAICYELIKLFCNYSANLYWVNLSDMRLLIRKSFAHVRSVSGVEVLSEDEKGRISAAGAKERYLNPKKVEEVEEVVDKSISTEENSARTDRYFSIDEEDRDMVDNLALAISSAVGSSINSQDVLEALAQSGISIYPTQEI